MKKNTKTVLALTLALVLCIGLLAGCSSAPALQASAAESISLSSGGTLLIKVNPEIAVSFDNSGNVTALSARNADAQKILAGFTGFEGKPAREVVSQLVSAIGNAGYFVEEIEGNGKKITIEIEPGSSLPSDTFLADVVDEVKTLVAQQNWTAPVDLDATTDYGKVTYLDTDYGTVNVQPVSADPLPTEPATTVPSTTQPSGTNTGNRTDYTDYGATDYVHSHANGTCNGNCTDYADTDYGPNHDGVTDYTDYGTAKKDSGTSSGSSTTKKDTTSSSTSNKTSTTKKTSNTDYGKTDYGKTDYNDNKTDYGKTDYNDNKTDYGKTDYNDNKTDYGKTDYN